MKAFDILCHHVTAAFMLYMHCTMCKNKKTKSILNGRVLEIIGRSLAYWSMTVCLALMYK